MCVKISVSSINKRKSVGKFFKLGGYRDKNTSHHDERDDEEAIDEQHQKKAALLRIPRGAFHVFSETVPIARPSRVGGGAISSSRGRSARKDYGW